MLKIKKKKKCDPGLNSCPKERDNTRVELKHRVP